MVAARSSYGNPPIFRRCFRQVRTMADESALADNYGPAVVSAPT